VSVWCAGLVTRREGLSPSSLLSSSTCRKYHLDLGGTKCLAPRTWCRRHRQMWEVVVRRWVCQAALHHLRGMLGECCVVVAASEVSLKEGRRRLIGAAHRRALRGKPACRRERARARAHTSMKRGSKGTKIRGFFAGEFLESSAWRVKLPFSRRMTAAAWRNFAQTDFSKRKTGARVCRFSSPPHLYLFPP